jgi:hypothetical protein
MDAEQLGHQEQINELNNYYFEQRLSDHYDNPRD